MLKYVNTQVTFREVPDEVTLCINISNCPNKCKGCHSTYLLEDVGTELTLKELYKLYNANKEVSTICFMGGDKEPSYINKLAKDFKYKYPNIKIAWYSGRQELSKDINLKNFDIIKLGPYIKELGPLNSKTTNQRFYKIKDNKLLDITNLFQNN